MSVIKSGKTFANGEQLTADKLNQVITGATFSATEAVDNSTTGIDGSGAIIVRDDGITTDKILNDAVTTAKIADDQVTTSKILDSNVTKAKIEDVADMKVLGNTSGSAAAPQEVSVLDEDDMSSDSATALATQQSIKAFVDSVVTDGTLPGQSGGVSTEGEQGSISIANLIIKYGTLDANTSSTNYTFTTAFPTAIIGVNATPQEDAGSGAEGCSVTSPSTTGFNLRSYSSSSGTAVGRVFWMAIGF